VFVIEQNRDAQMRTLLMVEGHVPQAKLVSVLNFDGMPLTAEFVQSGIRAHLQNSQIAIKPKMLPAGAAE